MDKFKLWKKWFWVGAIAAVLNPVVGLIYGIALFRENNYKKESAIIIGISVVFMGIYVFNVFHPTF